MDWSSEITGIFIKFCLGKRRFTKSEMKGKLAWGPRKMIIFRAPFSSHTECGLQIRKLWSDTFVNCGLCQTLLPGQAPNLHEQQRESCGTASSDLPQRLQALQAHRTCQLHPNCLVFLLPWPQHLANASPAWSLVVEQIPVRSTYEWLVWDSDLCPGLPWLTLESGLSQALF